MHPRLAVDPPRPCFLSSSLCRAVYGCTYRCTCTLSDLFQQLVLAFHHRIFVCVAVVAAAVPNGRPVVALVVHARIFRLVLLRRRSRRTNARRTVHGAGARLSLYGVDVSCHTCCVVEGRGWMGEKAPPPPPPRRRETNHPMDHTTPSKATEQSMAWTHTHPHKHQQQEKEKKTGHTHLDTHPSTRAHKEERAHAGAQGHKPRGEEKRGHNRAHTRKRRKDKRPRTVLPRNVALGIHGWQCLPLLHRCHCPTRFLRPLLQSCSTDPFLSVANPLLRWEGVARAISFCFSPILSIDLSQCPSEIQLLDLLPFHFILNDCLVPTHCPLHARGLSSHLLLHARIGCPPPPLLAIVDVFFAWLASFGGLSLLLGRCPNTPLLLDPLVIALSIIEIALPIVAMVLHVFE